MNYTELTQKERDIICQIAYDQQSGRHLLRPEKIWDGMPFTKEEYIGMWEKLATAIRTFSWFEDTDFSNRKNLEILICFKSCSNHDFDSIINEKC